MNTVSKAKSALTTIGIIFIVIIITAIGTIFVENYIKKDQSQVTVNIDKVVIVQEVKKLSKLETIKQVMQRDVEVTLNMGDFTAFGWTLLENKHTQKVAATGDVTAGIDLSKIKDGDVVISDDKKTLTITLPAPEILAVNTIEDKTNIIKDDLTLLFRLSSLSADKRLEAENLLKKQIDTAQKTAMVDAACAKNSDNKNVLDLANDSLKTSALSGIFGTMLFDKIEIKTTTATSCGYSAYGVTY